MRIKPPIEVFRSRASKIWTSRLPERFWGGILDRVSSCSSRDEGESTEYGASAECGRVSAECGRASARCSRVSLECFSTTISFCRRVSDCGELESDKLEGAEEGDIVKIWMACRV